MAWIKISDDDGGVYGKEAELDPTEIVAINELDGSIAELNIIKNNIVLPSVPENSPEDVSTIVEDCFTSLENYIATLNTEIENYISLKNLLLDGE